MTSKSTLTSLGKKKKCNNLVCVDTPHIDSQLKI